MRKQTFENVFKRVEKEKNGCWTWTGSLNHKGYGQVSWHGKVVRAHRIIYFLITGKEVPSNMTIDHLCRNRACVNPDHMEVVTGKENTLRGENFSACNKRKQFCPRGHSLSGNNLLAAALRHGGRDCKTCKREKHRERLRTDPVYREAHRLRVRAWWRKKHAPGRKVRAWTRRKDA